MAILAAVLWIAAAFVLPGNASAHPGHGSPVAAEPSAAAASGDQAPSRYEDAFASRVTLDEAVSASSAQVKQVPAPDCPRSCCAGSSACSGAFALDWPFIAIAPPGIQRTHRLATAAIREGVTPQALPEPPRSSV